MRLALGTAQFGLPYGIANVSGQVPASGITGILDAAQRAGLDTIDTAIGYGESERRLGEAHLTCWRIVTKIGAMPDGSGDVSGWVLSQAEGSLTRLRVPKLAGLLLHRPAQLTSEKGEALWNALIALKTQGLVEKIGYSIYSPEELDLLAEEFPPDLVQAPYNILDRRIARSGWLDRLNRLGTEVHARSVFLQGLLLMTEEDRPAKFNRWSRSWAVFRRWLDEAGLSPLQACLAFALSDPRFARVVVGVDSPSQFDQILKAARTSFPSFPDLLEVTDIDLLDPSRWHSL